MNYIFLIVIAVPLAFIAFCKEKYNSLWDNFTVFYKDFEEDIIPKSLYEILALKNSMGDYIIGGKYAVCQGTDTKFEENTIDIFINCFDFKYKNGFVVFEMIVKHIIEKEKEIKIIKEIRTLEQIMKEDENDPITQYSNKKIIVGTIILQYPNMNKEIRLIGINNREGIKFERVLENMMNVSCNMIYKAKNNERKFTIFEKFNVRNK